MSLYYIYISCLCFVRLGMLDWNIRRFGIPGLLFDQA